jgi:hypothetical protein
VAGVVLQSRQRGALVGLYVRAEPRSREGCAHRGDVELEVVTLDHEGRSPKVV